MAEYIVSVEKKEDAAELERTYACEELIRCKDCKWASYDCEWCLNPDAPVGGDECARLYIEPNWFCADGKRKEKTDDKKRGT